MKRLSCRARLAIARRLPDGRCELSSVTFPKAAIDACLHGCESRAAAYGTRMPSLVRRPPTATPGPTLPMTTRPLRGTTGRWMAVAEVAMSSTVTPTGTVLKLKPL